MPESGAVASVERLPVGTRRGILLSDSPMMRAGLRFLLPTREVQAVAELEHHRGLLERVRATAAQLVLAAPACGGHDELFATLDALPSDCGAIVLLAVPAFRIQANAVTTRFDVLCLPLNAKREEVHAGIQTVLRRDGPSLTVDEICSGVGGTLTAREQEVLRELAQGKANRQIAEGLWLSESTIKSHLHRIYRKLGVCTRSEAVALYIGQAGAA